MTISFFFCRSKTIREYSRHVRLFIAYETRKNPRFRARHWFGFASSNFAQLSDVSDYVPAGTGTSSAIHKICAYLHMVSWIRSELLKQKGQGKSVQVVYPGMFFVCFFIVLFSKVMHNNLLFLST